MRYYSLTSPQQNIWDLHKYYEDTSVCNISGTITFKSDIVSDLPAAIEYAVNELVKNADALRTRLVLRDGKVNQYFAEYRYEQIKTLDYTGFSDSEVKRKLQDEAIMPFDLIDNPLYRFFIIKQNTKISAFIVIHHLICDGWSATLLANSILEYVKEFDKVSKEQSSLYSYEDFIGEQDKYFKSRRFEKDEYYWNDFAERFEGISYIKPNLPKERDIKSDRYIYALTPEDSNIIFDYCSRKDISPDSLYKIAFAIYLYKINKKRNVVVGTPVFNRDGTAAKQTIGMYVSTMPLSVYVDENTEIYNLLEDCVEDSIGLFRHCKYPYRNIQEKVRAYNDNVSQLFDVMISYEDSSINNDVIESAEWIYQGYCENALTVHIDDRDGDNCLEVAFDYQCNVFSTTEEVQLLAKRIHHIITQMVSDDSQLVADLEIIPYEEYNRIVSKFNDTYSAYPRNKCIHDLFVEQVYKTPGKTAVVCDNRHLTYLELEHMSNNLALKMNLNAGEVVALHMERSEKILVVQLAVLKSGGIFLPIDTTVPIERLQNMLEDCGARYIVVDNAADAICFSDNIEVINIDTTILNRKKSTKILADVYPEMGAHIIYTSGSTGKPKGSVLTHRGLMNFVYHNLVVDPNNCGYDNSISINTISFDMFLCETITPLVVGITVHIATERQQTDQKLFAQYVKENDIQILQTTPTRYKILSADKANLDYMSHFKAMLLSGEPFTKDIYYEMRQHSSAKIYNTCGPSENHIWICGCELLSDDITLGTPIRNNKIYILDEEQRVLPVGVPGELCVSGDCIGLGYLNRPELNKEKYIPHPFIEGELLYRTGDLALFRPDGVIEPLGRLDSQVKIRGFRVELEEIESCISSNTEVSNVAVVLKKYKEKELLCAFYQAKHKIDESATKEVLSKSLPNYMIPNLFIHIDKFPMTSSGKISRRQLEMYDISAYVEADEYKAPETVLEMELCAAFRKILRLEQPAGSTLDFFESGGNSIHVIELLSQLAEKYNLTAKDVYDYSTPEKLAAHIETLSEKTHETLSCFNMGKGEQLIVCFPFAGSDDSTFIELAGEIKNNKPAVGVYALKHANWLEVDFEQALNEVESLARSANDVFFYSHCAGSAMALKIYQNLRGKSKIRHIVIGANVPPRGIKLYGNWFSPWKVMNEKAIVNMLRRAGMDFTGFSVDGKAKLIKRFRTDTDCYFREMAKMKGGIDAPCTVVVSDADIFTNKVDDVKKAWTNYFMNSVDVDVLHGVNHYFHQLQADELAGIICGIIDEYKS